jgi:ribosomal protein S18 acetylase RimI-like enzyme
MEEQKSVPATGASADGARPVPGAETSASARPATAPAPPVRPELAVRVVAVRTLDAEVEAAVRRLFPQLSSAPPPSTEDLEALLAAPGTTLLVAELGSPPMPGATAAGAADSGRSGGRIVGMLTLATFRVPSGVRAWIEDVVVDEEARGRGVGEALTREALVRAAAAGARTVELTSRPSREAANRLYRRIGFEVRNTNVYRIGT